MPEVDSVYRLARRMDRSLAGQRVLHSSPVAYDGHACGAVPLWIVSATHENVGAA